MVEKSVFEAFELDINQDVRTLLKETSNWTYFLSLIGFIGIAFMFFLGLFFTIFMGTGALNNSDLYGNMGFSMGYLGLVYVVLAVVYALPVYYLFNFSRKMKSALRQSNTTDFKLAISSLKSHYKFMGIFTIIIISLYLIIIIASLFTVFIF